MKDLTDYNLKRHNTFGMDVRCRRFIEFNSIEELQQTLSSLSIADQPLLLIGSGSNLLFTKDFDGTIIHSAIKGHTATKVDGNVLLRCGSGETWDDIVKLCVRNGLYGAENLSLIPGEVGASAIQNIGAYGIEAKDLIYEVEAVDISTGKIHTFANDYGNIRAELEAKGIQSPTAEQLREAIIRIRNQKLPDPKIEGNAGSFFTNPIVSTEKYKELANKFATVPHYIIDADHVKIPAGWMIEQCGWKGKTLGKAGVHSRQALVLVNKGGASGKDILHLCEAIKKDVQDKFGIEIKPEVNII